MSTPKPNALPSDAVRTQIRHLPDFFHQNGMIVAKETFSAFGPNEQAWYQPLPENLLPQVIKTYQAITALYAAGFAVVPPPHKALQNPNEIAEDVKPSDNTKS